MSHVVEIAVEIRDLDALAAAAQSIGMTLTRHASEYKWFGRWVGDYALPAGSAKEDLGKCSHKLSVTGKPNAYEIGLVARRDGRPGYSLLFDFWSGGNGLEAVAGKRCQKLVQAYSVEVVKRQAALQGYRATVQPQADGSQRVVLVRG